MERSTVRCAAWITLGRRSMPGCARAIRPRPTRRPEASSPAFGRQVLGIVVVLDHRNRVGTGEPAIEVDVSAAARAERAERVLRRLAADRAFLVAGNALVHGSHVVMAWSDVKGRVGRRSQRSISR